ncbi:hypothetical protein Y032_0026g1336 [Ancylostoma ceylanicum]|uniref:PWI domain-containing protein n=2 Tax=Ancylostoma ceylanicum TaxID=53326 RepID=A0A016UVA1_9BILA|nr:hypothetical protein Y032_0026g1336 [Ancylostoma ceylanicum]
MSSQSTLMNVFLGFPPQPQIFFNPIGRGFIPPQIQIAPVKQKPVTTVFVGNISEKCSNEFMQQMLQECGTVTTWKRIQGSNGKYQAFGFCDFEEPEGTLRALRVLNDFQIGEKKLVVKAEPKVREELRSWAIQHRKDTGKPELQLKEDELPADEDDLKKDEEVRLKILNWIDTDHPQLVTLAEDGELSDKEGKDSKKDKEKQKDEKKRDATSESKKDTERERRRRRSRSESRSRSRNERRSSRRSKSPKHKRRRRSTSYSGSSESSTSSDSSDSRSRSRSRERTPPKKRRERERSLSRSSEDSEEARERRNLKKQIKEKEQAYVARLTKWEARERQKAKQYEREERREKDRRRDILKEAKKLKHFLEDYDDEKDDPKYYKSSSLFQRKRDFEREREADSKDRLREQQEIEELRKQILAENKDIQDVDEEARRRHLEKEEAAMRRLREDSGSPNPHQPLGQRDGDGDSSSSSEDSDDEDDGKSLDGKSIPDDDQDTKTPKSDAPPPAASHEDRWKSVDVTSQSTPLSVSSPTITMRGATSSTSLQTLQRPELNARLNGVFGVDDEEEEGGRKHLRPFEITQEERMETLTTDEKKRMVKDLINNIPTTKDELFAHSIDWRFVDRSLIEQRVRPWVAKKILEFLGEEESALVDFVCEKVATKTSPDRILSDIAMILDEDAEVFVVKMWRLLIYESEAKKLGLVVPRSSQ